MAGMLAGVECARRRRFHQSGAFSDFPTTSAAHASSRRSSFCLYTTNHEFHLTSFSSMQRITLNRESLNEKLAEVAREAKERLDERLKEQRKSETKRTNRQERLRGGEGRSMVLGDLKIEVFGVKKRGLKSFSWAKFGQKKKALDQEECAVCLEQFKVSETLVRLPCSHRFHSSCLVPWLENNACCPCCRMEILDLKS
ncbi:unnamed protein product [Ilex paraguariensis]|uniref:RING-type E3 ubiquitin transferase n=1 Tax=Ilex paraguariensis TaxID=185542 RepID=A0ABC8R654_9AQUA